MSEFEGTFRRRLCLAVDIQRYTPHDVPWQRDAQDVLAQALDEAAHRCGLRRDDWWRQESGDGEVAVVDNDGAEPVAVEQFPIALSEALRTFSGKGEPRVRLAVHHGVTQRAARGFAGDGVIEVGRIVDADVVRDALDAAPGANLVLALSERTFLDVVRAGQTGLHPADFRRLPVRNKTYRGTAWVTVPGAGPPDEATDLTNGRDEADEGDAGRTPSVRQTAYGYHVMQAGRDMHVGSLTTVEGDLYAPVRGRRRG